MIILSYDIRDTKLRTRFSKFILQYGRRLQLSVYEIRNSKRILDLIMLEIRDKFEKEFTQDDSVFIFELTESCKITRFGYAKNEESDLIMV